MLRSTVAADRLNIVEHDDERLAGEQQQARDVTGLRESRAPSRTAIIENSVTMMVFDASSSRSRVRSPVDPAA